MILIMEGIRRPVRSPCAQNKKFRVLVGRYPYPPSRWVNNSVSAGMETCSTEVFVIRKTIYLDPWKNMHFVSEASKHAKLNEVEPNIPIRRIFTMAAIVILWYTPAIGWI